MRYAYVREITGKGIPEVELVVYPDNVRLNFGDIVGYNRFNGKHLRGYYCFDTVGYGEDAGVITSKFVEEKF